MILTVYCWDPTYCLTAGTPYWCAAKRCSQLYLPLLVSTCKDWAENSDRQSLHTTVSRQRWVIMWSLRSVLSWPYTFGLNPIDYGQLRMAFMRYHWSCMPRCSFCRKLVTPTANQKVHFVCSKDEVDFEIVVMGKSRHCCCLTSAQCFI